MKKGIEKSHKTSVFTRNEDVNAKWFVVDANGKILGRMASEIAKVIRGKNNPKFTPNSDTGDFVVVINAEKVRLTGKRETLKDYKHHSLYPGGQKIRSFKEMIEKHPDKVIRYAVRGMLPKTKLGDKLINKLKVYAGDVHPHASQTPESLNI
ncbi:MAG: 50S ribosomal protein L13 [Ignavibacteriae bacterium]|nr:MAG: 50S ribosomal protein L13 [Ignavibacteriota bacterium]